MKGAKERIVTDVYNDLQACAQRDCRKCFYLRAPADKICFKLLAAEAAELLKPLAEKRLKRKKPVIETLTENSLF